MPALAAWMFAAAGLACAAGPIVIHLLNRRRYRTVHWAAMDFLREALQRNRRILELRDLALLALRTLAVLLFGLALAQPFVSPGNILMWNAVLPCVLGGVLLAVVAAAMWPRRVVRLTSLTISVVLLATAISLAVFMSLRGQEQGKTFDGSQPLHAVLLIDNSLSMGYGESLTGTLLDRAKERAKDYIETLPRDSRVTVVPLCGSRHGFTFDPYNKEDAGQALDRLELVDSSAGARQALDLARRAAAAGPRLAKRVVLLGDQQSENWLGLSGEASLADLPPMQVVQVGPQEWENAWISDFRIENGLADVETPADLVVEVQYKQAVSQRDLQVTLTIDGVEAASKIVRLAGPEGTRQVRFQHTFSAYHPEPGQAEYVPVQASITPDKLPGDDKRHLVAHVVASLPVVFVDQYRAGEEIPSKNFIGETKSFRTMLAPKTSRRSTTRHLVSVRHVRLEDLNRDVLKDARLVVVAGVSNPQDSVPLLRQYVEQGGQLILAAGGDFDPAAWNEAAWLDGEGILPAPLSAESIGQLPSEVTETLKPFFLSFNSLSSHHYFRLADDSQDEMRDRYARPNFMFFKAVRVDFDDETIDSLLKAEIGRLETVLARRESATNQEDKPQDQSAKGDDTESTTESDTEWLLLGRETVAEAETEQPPTDPDARRVYLERRARSALPRAIARFDIDGAPPYLVERQIGRGRVLLMASGISSGWNTISTKEAEAFLYDRILRSMIQETLPRRNFPVQPRITLPLVSDDRDITLTLYRPGEKETSEILETGFIGQTRRGFSIDSPLVRGHYHITATKGDAASRAESTGGDDEPASTLWRLPLSVNGLSSESDLTPLNQQEFEDRFTGADVRWVSSGEAITLEGSQVRGQNFWKFLILAVLVFLLTELAILAFPAVAASNTATE